MPAMTQETEGHFLCFFHYSKTLLLKVTHTMDF